MPQVIRARWQRAFACQGLLLALAVTSLACLPSAMLHAQSPAARGYITAVRPPDGFDVNGEHVVTTADTRFGPIGAKNPASNGPMRDAVQIGAWVEVFGERDRKAKTVAAKAVLIRDDWDSKLSGLGVIDQVIATAPELVLAADGYRIRVTPATEVKLPRNAKSAADVRAGLWVLYEGKMGPDGLLVASKARFVSTDHTRAKAEKTPTAPAAPQPLANGSPAAKGNAPPPQDASEETPAPREVTGPEIQIDNDAYHVSKNLALQDRVLRIGWSLIPACQKHLPADDPAKIQFLFYAVDDSAHEEHTSSDAEGYILVPAQMVARFENDDQLAALLADGIALRLQQQAPMVIQLNRTTLAEAAGLAAVSFIPYAGHIAESVGGQVMMKKYERAMNEQRWRVALELMVEAGYDPWQSPEAWRLAAPGKLPADIGTLKYPDRSGYQLSILNRMYKKPAPTQATESGPTTGGSVSEKP